MLTTAHAEYRVYEYLVTNKNITNGGPRSSVKLSSYPITTFYSVNGGRKSIDVSLLRTWVCPGDTSQFQQYCKSPLQRISQARGEI
jgi:hypothetical protein